MARLGRSGYRWHVLPRHGRRPLAIFARLLLQADNAIAGLAVWSCIGLHETADGRYAAALRHVARHEAGLGWSDAWCDELLEGLSQRVLGHDPRHSLPATAFGPPASPATPDAAAAVQLAWHGLLAACFGLALRPGCPR